jgi:hypothetical protein
LSLPRERFQLEGGTCQWAEDELRQISAKYLTDNAVDAKLPFLLPGFDLLCYIKIGITFAATNAHYADTGRFQSNLHNGRMDIKVTGKG